MTLPVRCSNSAMKPPTLGASQFVGFCASERNKSMTMYMGNDLYIELRTNERRSWVQIPVAIRQDSGKITQRHWLLICNLKSVDQ